MNHLDVYYRALSDYRQQTLADHSCTSLRNAVASADSEQDKIVITRSICTIENDWVDAIEKGLIHIEKALKEERQFIRSNGEVVPIEKVKNVSRESITHLAKHSNLITQYEEGDDIVPEKLYTVERLSDFAVYENRFLYMLLYFLRTFITIRYNEILELSNKYDADISFNKKVVCGKQKITYTLSMHDVKRDDPYLKEINPAKDIIDRIHLLLKTVIAFLNTPLMQEVSKVSMLKPPITKTNVLKMNNNFRGAVALYEFIMAYDKKGYTIEPMNMSLAPLEEGFADELSEATGLLSFLTYKRALGLDKPLRESYLREEERRKVEKIRQRSDRIDALKRRLANSEISIEEYTLTLEDQLRELTGQADRAEKLADDLEAEREKTAQLTKEVETLNKKIESLCEEIEEMKQRHFEELQRLKQEHEDEMHELILAHEAAMQECKQRYEKEIAELNEKHTQEIAELNEKHAAEISNLKAEHEQAVDSLNKMHAEAMQRARDAAAEAAQRHESELSQLRESARENLERIQTAHREEVSDMQGRLDTSNTDLEQLQNKYDALLEDNRMMQARVKALGGINEGYLDRERFDELEREYLAFTKLYKQQWAQTKKKIKQQHLNINNLKPQKEKKAKKETDKGSDADK